MLGESIALELIWAFCGLECLIGQGKLQLTSELPRRHSRIAAQTDGEFCGMLQFQAALTRNVLECTKVRGGQNEISPRRPRPPGPAYLCAREGGKRKHDFANSLQLSVASDLCANPIRRTRCPPLDQQSLAVETEKAVDDFCCRSDFLLSDNTLAPVERKRQCSRMRHVNGLSKPGERRLPNATYASLRINGLDMSPISASHRTDEKRLAPPA